MLFSSSGKQGKATVNVCYFGEVHSGRAVISGLHVEGVCAVMSWSSYRTLDWRASAWFKASSLAVTEKQNIKNLPRDFLQAIMVWEFFEIFLQLFH